MLTHRESYNCDHGLEIFPVNSEAIGLLKSNIQVYPVDISDKTLNNFKEHALPSERFNTV